MALEASHGLSKISEQKLVSRYIASYPSFDSLIRAEVAALTPPIKMFQGLDIVGIQMGGKC